MILGITGTDGAGKGAAVDYLVRKKGFTHYSSREEITSEIEKRNIATTRANLREVANDMRRVHGNDVLVARALARINTENTQDAIIESIRAVSEMEAIKKVGGIVLAVDAYPQVRYRRIQGRKSSTDKVSYQQFLDHEKIEMNDPDPNGMQKGAVIAAADYTIMNNESMKQLHKKIDMFLAEYT